MNQCSVNGCSKNILAKSYCSSHYRRFRKYGNPLSGGPTNGKDQKGAPKKWILDHCSYEGDDCLDWPFCKNEHGYGRVGREKANRLMCRIAHGPPPTEDHESAHSCGNGHLGCVNPKHLRWATRTENQADRSLHGCDNKGERNGGSKLTEDQVLEIRKLWPSMRQGDIAELYGISIPTVSYVVNRRSWAWLT